ncbi:MAG: outer membrane lipoprotein-sorting protein [Gammaproteobacteria bacterium]|nr:outer membrane lipoprotein-sorting protein [Gammaproteobacteria bacterium]
MRAAILGAVLVILALATPAIAAAELPDGLDPVSVVDRVDRLLRGDSSAGEVQMRVSTRRWNRSMTLEIWSEGTENALVRVLEPRREAGTATLMVGSDIWNYLPNVDRTVRVPSSMMTASWMGSHFTNDDLVQRSRMVDDYTIETSFVGERDDTRLYEFKLTPRADAAVVWGAIELEVRADDLMPTEARYYGEDGVLRRTMTFTQFQEMGGRLVPTRIRMTPADRDGEFTEMHYRSLRFDIDIPPGTFSLQALR